MRKNNSLIVGGTKGIGKVISSVLEKRGDNIFTVSRNTRKKNNITLDLLSNKQQICKQLEYFFLKNKIFFDNIILCQRYRGKNPLEEFQVSVHSSKYLIDYIVAKNKIKNSIVFISSISARLPNSKDSLHYASSKSALETFVKGIAHELPPTRFNCIAPSAISTRFQELHSTKDRVSRIINQTPLKRLGDVDEVVNLIIFLLSDKASYITGSIYPITGGR